MECKNCGEEAYDKELCQECHKVLMQSAGYNNNGKQKDN